MGIIMSWREHALSMGDSCYSGIIGYWRGTLGGQTWQLFQKEKPETWILLWAFPILSWLKVKIKTCEPKQISCLASLNQWIHLLWMLVPIVNMNEIPKKNLVYSEERKLIKAWGWRENLEPDTAQYNSYF